MSIQSILESFNKQLSSTTADKMIGQVQNDLEEYFGKSGGIEIEHTFMDHSDLSFECDFFFPKSVSRDNKLWRDITQDNGDDLRRFLIRKGYKFVNKIQVSVDNDGVSGGIEFSIVI